MTERLTIFSLVLFLAACCAYQGGEPADRQAPQPVAAQGFPAGEEIKAPVLQGDLYSVHLYRHAEKRKGPDPELTTTGLARAQFIADQLSKPSAAIRQIWSSPYRRTMQTAEPLAKRLDIEISIYDPGNQTSLLSSLHETATDAVVIGHSNTIPKLAAMLCQCEVEDMPETEYDRAYIVVIGHGISDLHVVDMSRNWIERPTSSQ